MMPPLRKLKDGLHRTTEAIAHQLAQPVDVTPDWSDLEWRLAMAVAAVHGVSPLLCTMPWWQSPEWVQFLREQREHVLLRYRRIEALLDTLDQATRALGIAVVPLKGSALHGPGLYVAGDRPMADIDLLVDERDAPRLATLLLDMGYVESFAQWRHQVFKPSTGAPLPVLGEHRDTPINIEVHTRIQERLPISTVDITDWIYPQDLQPGLNAYPSVGSLMAHLLLHAAGNIRGRTLKLIQLNDIALLAMHMTHSDWKVLWGTPVDGTPWWALPPLRLVARYYTYAIPPWVLAALEPDCPALLRTISHHQTLTQASCSELWLHAFAGIEWSRSLGEAQHFLMRRVRPSPEAVKERDDMVRTQLWLQGQPWVTSSNGRRLYTWLTRSVPRMDTLFVIRAALDPVSLGHQCGVRPAR